MSTVPLDESKFAVADAAGKATVRLQPMRAFETWHITNTAVQSTSSVKIPTVKLYKGSETPSRFIEGSYTGTFNASDTVIDLPNGTALLAVFQNCDVGATCTVTLSGEARI